MARQRKQLWELHSGTQPQNHLFHLLASVTDKPHKAPAALSWRPGEAFEQAWASATWVKKPEIRKGSNVDTYNAEQNSKNVIWGKKSIL